MLQDRIAERQRRKMMQFHNNGILPGRTVVLALIILLLATLLAACGLSAKETPVLTAAVTATPAIILTADPTATLTSEPTVAPTITPSPSPTTTPALSPPPENIVSRIWEKDGMEQVFVPAGEFIMKHAEFYSLPPHSVYLDAYWIDKTEITNTMFTQFVSETHYWTDAEKDGKGRIMDGIYKDVYGANWEHPQGPTSDLQGKDHWPVTQVSWNDAAAYCAWAGKHLPTEAEWEKAARGTDGRKYPWGNDAANCSLANIDKGSHIYCVGEATEAGSYPDGASPYGALDMIGNVWEWVNDWLDTSEIRYFYPNGVTVNNPAGAATGIYKILRGGGWNLWGDSLHVDPSEYANIYGFRCVSSADE